MLSQSCNDKYRVTVGISCTLREPILYKKSHRILEDNDENDFGPQSAPDSEMQNFNNETNYWFLMNWQHPAQRGPGSAR